MNRSQSLIAARYPDRSGNGGSAIVQAIMGFLAGAIAGVAALEAQDLALVAALAACGLIVLAARGERWTALGGFVLGFGGLITLALSPAVNNADPAVGYTPSTVPALVLSMLLVVLGGLAMALIAARRIRLHRPYAPPPQPHQYR
jgi:hypothetical protein